MFLVATDGGASVVAFSVTYEVLIKLIAAMAVAGLALVIKKAWPTIKAHLSGVWRLRRAEIAVDASSPGIWLAPSISIEPHTDYERSIKQGIPVIVVANLKGGVGKTTVVSNLIGHYGNKKKKRVLVIDLDFQGSLSAIILTEGDYKNSLAKQEDGTPSKSAQLIAGVDGSWIINVSEVVDTVPDARCIPTYYTLSNMENRVMVEWLIGTRTEDIRYSLAQALQSRQIQDRFDIVLIDAPPRLTTGCVQALCAATHVLVPTVLDELSAEAAAGFVNQLSTNQKIWPHLKLLGVVGNMTNNATATPDGKAKEGALADYEATTLRTLNDTITAALERAHLPLRAATLAPLFPIQCFIPDKRELGRQAGNRICYRVNDGSESTQDVSRSFDRLGDEIDRRILAANG